MKDETHGRIERGWDAGHGDYACFDGIVAIVPHKFTNIRELDERKTAPRNRITYKISRREQRIAVSGVEYSRDMTKIFGGPDDVRTIIFPKMVRSIRQCSFYDAKSLRIAILNEGLEVLGTDECMPDGKRYPGVFQESGLRQVRFPSTLRRIGYKTFMDCDQLKIVHFPEKLECIGGSSFLGAGLESVELPASVRIVDQCSFCMCKSLKYVRLNEGLKALGIDEYTRDGGLYYGVFFESALERINLPSTLKRIEYNAFQSCENLKSIDFPKGLEYIGKQCFARSALVSVELPASLRTVAQGAFAECESLKSVKFADGLEALGTSERAIDGERWAGVFEGSPVVRVKLPSTLKRIEDNTFAYCADLKSIDLPAKLEYIGESCFQESGLESVHLPSVLRTIEDDTFRECEKLKDVVLPDCLEKVGPFAFFQTGLRHVEFPASLRTVAQGAFAECRNLKYVKLNERLEVLGTDQYHENGKLLYGVFEESAVENVQLPSTLKRIEYGAFENCKNLQSIRLPDNLEYIGKECFYGSGLAEVPIPRDGVQAEDDAFYDCPAKDDLVFRDGRVFPKDQ